jgi:hypothetical protein
MIVGELYLGTPLPSETVHIFKAMVRAPVLALPNATDPFILDTDASDRSVGVN